MSQSHPDYSHPDYCGDCHAVGGYCGHCNAAFIQSKSNWIEIGTLEAWWPEPNVKAAIAAVYDEVREAGSLNGFIGDFATTQDIGFECQHLETVASLSDKDALKLVERLQILAKSQK